MFIYTEASFLIKLTDKKISLIFQKIGIFDKIKIFFDQHLNAIIYLKSAYGGVLFN